MNFSFRLDASIQIGNGHLMRCLTLADALKKQGIQSRFVCRHMPEHLQDRLLNSGHEFKSLAYAEVASSLHMEDQAGWLRVRQVVDMHETMEALSDRTWDWLVVDHYGLDATWELGLRSTAKHICVIDDLADRQHDCDVLLDQNIYPDITTRYAGKVPQNCRLLLGPNYALLRDEFLEYRTARQPRDGSVRRVLILMGGADAHNLTEKAIRAVASISARSFEVDVVIGKGHPIRDEIVGLCRRYAFHCHIEASNVAELMSRADLAIGSSGSASWERCCLGLPTVCLTQAHNQIAIAEGLHDAGAIVNLGDGLAVGEEQLSKELLAVINNPDWFINASMNASQLVDGRGVRRVCESLMEVL